MKKKLGACPNFIFDYYQGEILTIFSKCAIIKHKHVFMPSFWAYPESAP